MGTPRVPGESNETVELPCGEHVSVRAIDLGMREYHCHCGSNHAVVLDVHPPSRFVPESIVEILQDTVESTDDFGPFGTPHLLGLVLEEFPEAVVSKDTSEDGMAGFSMVWMTDFDSRRLHEIIVELIVEVMEHAVSHAHDETIQREFEDQMLSFDIGEFVEIYRRQRDFEDEFDQPL